ncbi:alpha-D-ribose 1-methylphosphonate 5-triphosphate synthase subunit PhnH [Rhizobium skierniewicense]|uniref:Alpha-D-ribose 1-methylphosphonate 5-triphosphate synthase subunit PhnH n=1 Tax=Rhizobium skierniewicense TaxID=984260 RepID=A0A7W6G091_9HYPH|nr:phosphonate C-P lyase system protein PhnH [Rhizobium skierniewicense]MBB3944452.1 alpha-D-ribose 1-methylphosphonate 5-triphosphate synthase subunit PhnH [Rhizobium skierniewicense]NTF33620.1 phosphonate C-P lyase system protein PhnH [Rhizobium skierniewicense]
MQTATFDGGFTDPVFASQSVFRAVMDAFSRPGTNVDLGTVATGPAPLTCAASAILLTLADYDTPVWFENAGDMQSAAEWLVFHSGAPVTPEQGKASFAVLSEKSRIDNWKDFAVGTMSYPDRSATLILPVHAMTGGTMLQLSGPGIENTHAISPSGLPEGFAKWALENNASYPLGLDVIIVCGSEALALPRTTRIKEI